MLTLLQDAKPSRVAGWTGDLPSPAPSRVLISLDRVRKTFAGARGEAPVRALDDVSLEVAEGEVFGIIGRSGAGKSTLIRLINGLETPSSGELVVDGESIAALDPAALRAKRRRIGMIFQHFNLLSSRTVYGNVALPLELEGTRRAEIRSRVEPLLHLVGLADKRNRYPAELSGGQKQRVAIARALATNPQVLLSDEATSALDPETTRSILALLAQINRDLGLTIVLITHEMAVIKQICRRVAVLENGRLVEQGFVGDVFTAPRAEVTRTLVASAIGAALPDWLAGRLLPHPVPNGAAIARIVFRGPHATEPIIARLSRELGLDVSILSGQVDELGGEPFGVLTVSVPGGTGALDRVRGFIARHRLGFEVLGHVSADR